MPRLRASKDDLSKARTARIQAEANLSALENQQPGAPNQALDAAADEIIASDTGLAALKTSLSQKRAVLLDQLAGLTPNHPLRKTTEEQLAEIEASLQQMQTDLRRQASINLEQKLRTEVRRTQTVESQLTLQPAVFHSPSDRGGAELSARRGAQGRDCDSAGEICDPGRADAKS